MSNKEMSLFGDSGGSSRSGIEAMLNMLGGLYKQIRMDLLSQPGGISSSLKEILELAEAMKEEVVGECTCPRKMMLASKIHDIADAMREADYSSGRELMTVLSRYMQACSYSPEQQRDIDYSIPGMPIIPKDWKGNVEAEFCNVEQCIKFLIAREER